MKINYVAILLFLIISANCIAQSTIKSIPNQKLINGSYVSNPDNILDGNTILRIDSLLKATEKNSEVQVAVVVVSTIGDEDIFEFAQMLYNTWGIGADDNGLLVLLVNDLHTIRFHTGYGVEGALPDVVCKRIQRDYMVPEFKKGNINAGMFAGLLQVNHILTNPVYAEEFRKNDRDEVSGWTSFLILLSIFVAPVLLITFIVKNRKGRFKDSLTPEDTPYPEMLMTRWGWITIFVAIPLSIVILYGTSSVDNAEGFCIVSLYFYFLLTPFHRLWRMRKVINRFVQTQNFSEIVEFLRKQQWYWFLIGLAFPIPFFPYFFYHLARKRIFRNHPRNCKQCQHSLRKLNEKAEDEYLTEGQQLEEKIKAVDYDIWKCTSCETIEVWFYLNNHSKYDPCPKCKTIAYHSVSKRTVVNATYSSSGQGEEVHACKFCAHEKKSSYSIPQLVAATSSSSSYSGGSSSSGGSWGGGRSGGGGASSSW